MINVCVKVSKLLHSKGLHASMSIYFFVVILKSNTTSVKRTINNFKTTVEVVSNHAKKGWALISCSLPFKFRFSNSELYKATTDNLTDNMKPSSQLRIFILLVKNESNKGASVISPGTS